MKILQVNKYYHPDVGGVETVCQQYTQALSNEHDVTVLCVSKKFSLLTRVEIIDGVKVYRCSSFGTFFSMPISISFYYYFIYLSYINSIVISHLPFPLFDFANYISKKIKINYKLYLIWHSEIVRQKKFKKILTPLFQNTLISADVIITTSPNMIRYSSMLRLFKQKCVVIPLSIDQNSVNKLGFSRVNFDECEYDGVFFGRLTYYKGAVFLIDSLIRAKKCGFEFSVLIAGTGEDAEYIKDAIIEGGLSKVTFINRFLSEEEKYTALSKARCFLFPSITHSEAFGITQIEALVTGTPIINTHLRSGVPWVSKHLETGLTVDPYDQGALIDAIKQLSRDSSLNLKLSNRCKLVAKENFEFLEMKKNLLALISK